jgi:hypothetical protein
MHPELNRLFLMEIEQHASAFRQFLAVHQSDSALGRIGGQLNRKRMYTGTGHDFDCVLGAGGAGRRQRGEQRPAGNEPSRSEPRKAAQRPIKLA